MISLIDGEQQWFKSKIGLDINETHRDIAFCAHAILGEDIFNVPDSSLDERFQDNPLVTGFPKVKFYAGAPIITPEGYSIGTICVIDNSPKTLNDKQINALKSLSRNIVSLLELRLKLNESQNQLQLIMKTDNKNKTI